MAVESKSPVLVVDGVGKHFGGLAALSDISFEVGQAEVVGLIGPNGAGKSTCINVISGFFPPDKGKIRFKGDDITGMGAHLVTHKGLVRTFQLATFFKQSTVLEHLMMTATQAQRVSPLSIFLGLPSGRKAERHAKRRAMELIDLMGLGRYANSKARELPTGYQRWLGLTMALALEPALLLLDEPLSGLNADEMDRTVALLGNIKKERGLSILLVEHNMRAVMSFCDRIVVLNFGRKICEGSPDFVQRDPGVIEAYLGGEDGAVA